MKRVSWRYIFTLVFLSLTINVSFGQPVPIAHALGYIDGYTYTNSREAMINSIERGFKYLEVDIDTTSDGVLVASHDWEMFNDFTGHAEMGDSIISFDEFSQRKIYGVYTPISIKEIVDTLKKYTDISIMTDKISDPVIIEKCFSEIKDRVYVECFTNEDYFELKKLGYNAMLSTYTTENTLTHIVSNLITGTGRIDFIATSSYQDLNELKKLRCVMPIKVSLYNIETKEDLDELWDDVDFFYTDYYDPSTGVFNSAEE